jgi:hypothetical protein
VPPSLKRRTEPAPDGQSGYSGPAMWAPRKRWWTLALIAAAMVLATAGLAGAEHWIYPAKYQDIQAVVAGHDRSGRLGPAEDVTGTACRSGRCQQAVLTATNVLVVRFATRELAAEAVQRQAPAGRTAYRSEWVVVSWPAGTPASETALFQEIFPESEKTLPAP